MDPQSRPDPDPFLAELHQLEQRHLRRRLRRLDGASATTVTLDGRPVILLASNNYLGLASHPTVIAAATDALRTYGAGAGASRLVSGTLPPHVALEEELAAFKRCDATLLFGAGYLANVGLIPALARPGDLVLADRLCHASLIDGCRLSGATFRVFQHNDVEQLDRLLARRAGRGRALVVTEGVFSMDGDAAPLAALLAVTQARGARLLVDDAHGTGIMGPGGRGTVESCELPPDATVQMGTLGKALGTAGAYVGGSSAFIEYLVNTARSFIYSTAPPPAIVAAARAALEVMQREPERRDRLWANRTYLHDGLRAAGFRLTATVSPILPVLVGDPSTAVEASRLLLERGIYAPAIRPPTVPDGTSRIRCTVSSEHTRPQLDAVLAAFTQIGQRLRLTA